MKAVTNYSFVSIPSLFLFIFLSMCVIQPMHSATTDNVDSGPVPELYYDPMCSHCQKVLDYLEGKDTKVLKKNIRNYDYRRELINLGAKSVPVLVVNNQMITGAKNIIAYLKNHERQPVE